MVSGNGTATSLVPPPGLATSSTNREHVYRDEQFGAKRVLRPANGVLLASSTGKSAPGRGSWTGGRDADRLGFACLGNYLGGNNDNCLLSRDGPPGCWMPRAELQTPTAGVLPGDVFLEAARERLPGDLFREISSGQALARNLFRDTSPLQVLGGDAEPLVLKQHHSTDSDSGAAGTGPPGYLTTRDELPGNPAAVGDPSGDCRPSPWLGDEMQGDSKSEDLFPDDCDMTWLPTSKEDIQPTVVWCESRYRKSTVGRLRDLYQGRLLYCRTSVEFTRWMFMQHRGDVCPWAALVTGWREAKPCLAALAAARSGRAAGVRPDAKLQQLRPITGEQGESSGVSIAVGVLVVVLDKNFQEDKAVKWAKMESENDSGMEIHVVREAQLLPLMASFLRMQTRQLEERGLGGVGGSNGGGTRFRGSGPHAMQAQVNGRGAQARYPYFPPALPAALVPRGEERTRYIMHL